MPLSLFKELIVDEVNSRIVPEQAMARHRATTGLPSSLREFKPEVSLQLLEITDTALF